MDNMTAEQALEELLDAATSIVMTADFDEAERWAAIVRARFAAPRVPQPISEPVAWAVFSERENIRIWCSDPIQLESLRAEYGDQLKPLYMLDEQLQRAVIAREHMQDSKREDV